MGLFNTGYFKLHSGDTSNFKINCDSLSLADLAALAWQIDQRIDPYGFVEGVPTGGDRLARLFKGRATGKKEDGLLILDDVYTTGTSMEAHRNGREARGFVLFARCPITHPWIKALFTMEHSQ